jgi:thiol:disulfide interchange protein DsbC
MFRQLIICYLALYGSCLAAAEPDRPDLSKLQGVLGETKPDSVNPTAVPGLYEVVLGSQIVYLSEDGRFAIQGDIVDLNARSNVTEQRREDLRAKAVEALGDNKAVVFAPLGTVKHTVTVFTDIDCTYCRKFHSEIAAYNQNGIKIRYLMYPRAGIGSDSYQKAVAVWCADNRQEALTRAKRGEEIPRKTCDNPVKAQYELGSALGIRGTPSIILEHGEMLPGYVPPAQLVQILEDKGPRQ